MNVNQPEIFDKHTGFYAYEKKKNKEEKTNLILSS